MRFVGLDVRRDFWTGRARADGGQTPLAGDLPILTVGCTSLTEGVSVAMTVARRLRRGTETFNAHHRDGFTVVLADLLVCARRAGWAMRKVGLPVGRLVMLEQLGLVSAPAPAA